MSQRESAIEFEILIWLNKHGYFSWKNSSTGVYDETKQSYRRGSVFQIVGVSDIISIKDGVVYFFEVKAENGKLSKGQVAFSEQVRKHGGLYFVVRSIEDVVACLKN